MSIKPSNITSSYLSAYTTNTLTFSDIINHSEYEASSVSLSWWPTDVKGDWVRMGGHLSVMYDGTIGAMPQVYDGLSETLPQMWENSPTEAKAVLVTAGGIVVLPFVYVTADYGITYAYMNPEKVLLGYEAVDVGIGMFDGNPPNNAIQTGGFLFKRYIIDRDFSSPFQENQKNNNEQ